MKKEILDTLPHHAIEELIIFREYLKQITSENINLITLRDLKDDSILCEFIENQSQYAFVVKDFKYDARSRLNTYAIYRRPESLKNMTGVQITGDLKTVKDNFQKWMKDCHEMNEIKRRFLNPDSNFYDQEFSDFFSNNDPDALKNPFEINRQEILYYFLTFAEEKITKSEDVSNDIKEELISELSDLKKAIPQDTKKVFVHKLSKFAQKTKKVSNKLFDDVFDVLKKEIIKKVLYEGAEQLPNIASKVQHWITVFTS